MIEWVLIGAVGAARFAIAAGLFAMEVLLVRLMFADGRATVGSDHCAAANGVAHETSSLVTRPRTSGGDHG